MTEHSLRRLWLAIGWIGIAIVVWYSLKPNPPELGLVNGDKIQHFAAYGSLMWWFAQVVRARLDRARTAGWLVALGAGVEIAQSFTGYREASVYDGLANATGVLIGWSVAHPRLPDAFAAAQRWLAPRSP